MKYLGLMIVLCLSLAVPAAAIGTNPLSDIEFYVTKVSEKKLEVTLANLQSQRTTVTIENLDGSTIYFRDIVTKHNGYRKRLNLDQLPNGKYKLIVTNGEEKKQQVIVLKAGVGMLLSSIK